MGLIDDKKDIFTTIGSYTSLAEDIGKKVGTFVDDANDYAAIGKEVDTTNLLPSVNNKDEIVPFLLDVLGVTIGTESLKQLIGQLLTQFIDLAEPILKEALTNQLIQFNSGDELPSDFITNGVNIQVADIDIDGKFRNSPQSDVGSLLYDTTGVNFDSLLYDSISIDGPPVNYNDMLLITYDSALDSVNFKPHASTVSDTVGDWFTNYVGDTTLLNSKELMSKMMDRVFGSMSSNEDKSVEQLTAQLTADRMLQRAIDGDEDFTVPTSEYDGIVQLANELYNGLMEYDMGCGLIAAELPLSGLTELVDDIVNSSDPQYVSDRIASTLATSFTETQGTEESSEENAETIKNGFFNKLIQFLQLELTKRVTISPEARMLYAMASSFVNDGVVQIENVLDDLNRMKTDINCIIRKVVAALNEYIFNVAVGVLIALVAPLILKFIRERVNQYIGIIKSLVSSKIDVEV